MKTTKTNRNFHDIESRKKGPFSVFIMSYELPPEPTSWTSPTAKCQYMADKHKARKVAAREWHRNPARRVSTPPNVLV